MTEITDKKTTQLRYITTYYKFILKMLQNVV